MGNNSDETLRKEARAYLPAELRRLAETHGFRYNRLAIRKSRTRWGSCSSKKNINLSLFLMILPPHLIEYVLLHELCHTVEMNHGPRFWELLNRYTDGRAKALQKELRGYHIPRPPQPRFFLVSEPHRSFFRRVS
jgi:predicted metal-dependent hydrolase